MKTFRAKQKTGGFNFIDLMIVVVTILLFLTVGLPWLAQSRSNVRAATRISCVSNLKQVGLAVRMFANDNGGKFPMAVSTNKGGSMELIQTTPVSLQFGSLSNYLVSPKILWCPEDKKRTRATNWISFSNLNISYFIGLEADETQPQAILSGDRNITGGILTNGNLMLFKTNSLAAWTTAIHNKAGNIGLGDGSVQQANDQGLQRALQAEFQVVSNEVIRLAIP